MKIFFYKTLFAGLVFFIVFKITIGSLLNEFERKITDSLSKEKIEFVKEEVREQINQALKKEKIIKKNDAELIKKFLNKIKIELE